MAITVATTLAKLAGMFTRPERVAQAANRDGRAHDITTVAQDFVPAAGYGVWRGPIGDMAIDAGTGTVVVSNCGDDSVTVIRPDLSSVVGVPVDGEPFAVALADDRAYVTTSAAGHDAIVVLDTATRTVTGTYPLAFAVTALAVSPDGKRVFAGRAGQDSVDIAVIDVTAERVGTIDVAKAPAISIDALRVDASGKRLYVATSDARGARLFQINAETARVESALPIGAPIRDLVLGAAGTAYVLTSDRARGGAVDVIDLRANTILDSIDLGGAPTQMAISPDGNRLYVVDYDQVVVLCLLTNEVVSTITVAARPSCVAVSADGGRVYVADYTGQVTAFSVALTIPLRYTPVGTELIARPARPALERATA